MKAAKLAERLQSLDPNTEVIMRDQYGKYYPIGLPAEAQPEFVAVVGPDGIGMLRMYQENLTAEDKKYLKLAVRLWWEDEP